VTVRQTLSPLSAALFGVIMFVVPASAQSWAPPDMLAAAKTETSEITVYGSMNEEEALPFYKIFENTTGIKVNYVRGSDSALFSRITIEARAGQRTWDMVVTTPVNRFPDQVLLKFEPPEAKGLIPQARGPNGRWYGVYANYNTPAYNTNLVRKEALPKTYEEFLDHKDWAGHVAIDKGDQEWLAAIFEYYGEQRGRKLVSDIATTLKPVLTDGHLALARAVGAGEYMVALNNYTSLTLNVRLAGGPTDFWALNPVALIFGSMGLNAQAPHPKAALLAANFVLSREGETFLTTKGRLPTRLDVATNPPGVIDTLQEKKVMPEIFSVTEEKKWGSIFNELLRPR
jgi:iron(III) transport system substrate-binding protein